MWKFFRSILVFEKYIVKSAFYVPNRFNEVIHNVFHCRLQVFPFVPGIASIFRKSVISPSQDSVDISPFISFAESHTSYSLFMHADIFSPFAFKDKKLDIMKQAFRTLVSLRDCFERKHICLWFTKVSDQKSYASSRNAQWRI